MTVIGNIRPLRWIYLLFVWLIILFVLLPLVTMVWVAFFSNKILSFPPEGYTGAWFVQAWSLVRFQERLLSQFPGRRQRLAAWRSASACPPRWRSGDTASGGGS